jgi:hypothetical protein
MMLASARARLHDVAGFVAAAVRVLAGGDENQRVHVLRHVATALQRVGTPSQEAGGLLEPLLGVMDPGTGDPAALFTGLWHACEGSTAEWTGDVVRLFSACVGEVPEPWRRFRACASDDDASTSLVGVHPEVREAVGLILQRVESRASSVVGAATAVAEP